MVKVLDTSLLDERAMKTLSANEAAWVYNGLDCCVTAEIFNVLTKQIESEPEEVQQTYNMACAKLAPIMEMSLRGNLIDEGARQQTIKELEKDLTILDKKFQHLCTEVFGGPINWRSPTQLKGLFYTSLGLKERRKRNQKGQYVATVNRETLEHFQSPLYLHAQVFARFVLILRDLHKQVSFLKTGIDRDQRIRTSYNIAGTNTGRLSSSMSDFGTGTNLQNVDRKLRYPFVADPGYYLVNVDLEQADGRNVGAICWNLFYDADRATISRLLDRRDRQGNLIIYEGEIGPAFAGSYLDACESGDLHTTVCQMVWPSDLAGTPWPTDEAEWKSFCDGIIAHGQDSFRQLSKKGGHGTNYYGTPRTMAKHLHTNSKIIENFQTQYFDAFPCIPAWHNWTIEQIKEFGSLTTLFGRRRTFFGRANDATTHRKAIAYSPQSMTGEQIDRGLLQVWRAFPQVQLLNQVHDSILFQVPFSEAEELIPKVLEVMQVTLELKGGRKFTVPLEAAAGWNWGYWDQKKNQNIYGLAKWKGKEERQAPNPMRRLGDYLKYTTVG